MPNMDSIGVKGWYIKTKPSKLFFFLILMDKLVWKTHLFHSHVKITQSIIKCSDEFGEHAHKN